MRDLSNMFSVFQRAAARIKKGETRATRERAKQHRAVCVCMQRER